MYSTNTADFCGLCEPRINDRKDIYKNHPQVEQNQVKKHKRVSWTSVDFYKSCFNFANYPIFCGKLAISHLLRYSIACITAHRAFHMLLNMKKRMRNLLQSLPNQNENKKVKQKKEAALVGWKGMPRVGIQKQAKSESTNHVFDIIDCQRGNRKPGQKRRSWLGRKGGAKGEDKHCQRHNGPRNWLHDLD